MVLWWQIVVTVVCITLSGTFSGLTLGLMSLDIIDLRVLTESGTDKEKWYARRILPVRTHGNWLLCTLLIGNTAVNSALSIVTADLFGGIPGFLTSTIAILYIGEIIPQAICHRFGLVIGAYAIPLVKLLMFLTAPLSFTTAKLLDCLLGGEPVTRYNKSQLKSLLSIHGTLHHGPTPDPASPGQSRDLDGTPINAVIANSDSPDVTIVELQQISSSRPDDGLPPSPPSQPVRGPHKRASTDFPRHPTTPAPPDDGDSMHPSADEPRERSRTRSNPVSRLYELTRSRFADKSTRTDREKRDRERESVSSNPPLTKDEMAMLGGAFDFSQKTVAQVMTALNDVFMLEASLSLNFEVLLIIFQSGHSRVPVYDRTRDNIIGVLFAKDLILLDPEDSVPIKTVLLFFNRTVLLVFYDTTLNKMLNIFRQGGGHMAIVQQKKQSDDPMPDTLGIVTLEDLIEELIGQDIVDETDVYTDNINKQRVKRVRSIDPEVLKMFDSKHDEELLSEKEVLVVASYLSNNTEEFSEKFVDTNILRKMLAEIPIVEYNDDNRQRHAGSARGIAALAGIAKAVAGAPSPGGSETHIDFISNGCHPGGSESSDQGSLDGHVEDPASPPDVTIYTRGVPTKNAYLIINGRLEISAGNDGFISEAGPWTFLGVSALTDDLYAPDFTARVIERPARLLRIPRRLYRLLLQYSAADARAGIGDSSRGKRMSSSASSNSPSSTRRRSNMRPGTAPSSSLALAAAAAAVAVGNPKSRAGELPLPGTASDAPIVRKTRSRPNGQSIEWSEMEPGLVQAVETSRRGTSLDLVGRSRLSISKEGHDAVEILKPPTGQEGAKPPQFFQESGQDGGAAD